MDRENIKLISGYTIFMDENFGVGGFSSVYLCEKEGRRWAVKIMQISPDKYKEQSVKREVQALTSLYGDNIVSLREYLRSQNNHYFVMEICDGNILKLMRQPNLSEQKAVGYLSQIVNGYSQLYKAGVIHRYMSRLSRDIKPANILYLGNTLKLADFGTCKFQSKKQPEFSTHTTSRPISIQYTAPEVLKNEPCSYKIDIWSIGLILYQMLHKKLPWEIVTEKQTTLANIKNTPLKIRSQISENTKDFLNRSLKINPNQRISFEEMINHPIFSKSSNQNKEKMVISLEPSYAELLMQELVKDANMSEQKMKNITQSLHNLGGASNFMTEKDFQDLVKFICPQIDETKQKTLFNYYANNDGLIEVVIISSLFVN